MRSSGRTGKSGALDSSNASKNPRGPLNTSSTPVKPLDTMSAADTPLRAGIAPKSNDFSRWSGSRIQHDRPDACCAAKERA